MAKEYDIKVRSVHDYNAFVGAEDHHALVSIIHYNDLPPIRHCRCLWGIYGIFLLEVEEESLEYGSGHYNYSQSSIVCVAPSQIGGSADDGTRFQRKGWALLFSPEVFQGKTFEKSLLRFEFFKYHVNEALVVDNQEQKQMKNLLEMLQGELYEERQDCNLIEKIIELLLVLCNKLFNKQYSLPLGTKRIHIISRMEKTLADYYQKEQQHLLGVPTVKYCAKHLCVAPNYLGDLVKEETGENAHIYIAKHIVRLSKGMLMSGKSVTETSYSLGFDYPSHFGRFFKRIEGITPSEYIKRMKVK